MWETSGIQMGMGKCMWVLRSIYRYFIFILGKYMYVRGGMEGEISVTVRMVLS